jgi:hypothetical protein
VDRADHPLRLPVVADRAPHLLDPAGDRRLRDEPAAPDRVHQLFLRHDPVPMRHQVGQHVERLRLERHRLPVAAQLVQGGVELESVGEGEHHASESATPVAPEVARFLR